METHAEIQTDALFIAWSENRRTNKTPQPLQEWIRQYPEATSDLTQWVAESPVAERAEYRVASALEEARAIEIGRNVIAEMRARYQTAAPVALASLYETARSQGVNPKSLATQLGIGLSTLEKLQRRLFRFTSLPQELITRLSDALNLTATQVRAYLQQPATLSAHASYKSEGVPQITSQEDFAEAVSACHDMTPEQKTYWQTVLITETDALY